MIRSSVREIIMKGVHNVQTKAKNGDWYDAEYFGDTTKNYKSQYQKYNVDIPLFRFIAETLIEVLPFQSFLDVGCARGYIPYYLRKTFGKDSWGIDQSSYAIQTAPLFIQPYLMIGDIVKFTHARAPFDIVFSRDVLEHVDVNDIPTALHNAWRMTRVCTIHGISCSLSGDLGSPGTNGIDTSHVSMYSPTFWGRIAKKIIGEEGKVYLLKNSVSIQYGNYSFGSILLVCLRDGYMISKNIMSYLSCVMYPDLSFIY